MALSKQRGKKGRREEGEKGKREEGKKGRRSFGQGVRTRDIVEKEKKLDCSRMNLPSLLSCCSGLYPSWMVRSSADKRNRKEKIRCLKKDETE